MSVHVSEFDKKARTAVLETDSGKISITFDEWKKIVDMYETVVGNKG